MNDSGGLLGSWERYDHIGRWWVEGMGKKRVPKEYYFFDDST